MKTASIYGAFNARWLEPEVVAKSFIPTPHFKNLVRLQNSLLMGPRGCGKTTLMKMLTRRAQRVWRDRIVAEPQWAEYRLPEFEAIYVPSDVRWNAELNSISQDQTLSQVDAERLQRALVSLSSITEATRAFQILLDEASIDPTSLLKSLITHLALGPTVPSFPDVRLRLRTWAEELQSLFVRQDTQALLARINQLPSALTGNALAGVTRACTIFDEYQPTLAPSRWALCFDELEIAPRWLQTELLAALRSIDQRFLFKLTWSPILPTDLQGRQERQHDYDAIRMWHGHASEAKPFCREFTLRFIRDKFNNDKITPRDVLGVSPFAQEDRGDQKAYARNGPIWTAMVRLAQADISFREYLVDHDISPTDPIADDVSLRDETLRKIKPIVLLRDAYLRETENSSAKRSRKNPPLYYGEDAVYAMSEGNPRLLAGLLNDLLDAEVKPTHAGRTWIKPEVQSKLLSTASQRTLAGIKAYPIRGAVTARALSRLVERMGTYLHAELVNRSFTADPVGGFIVDADVSPEIVDELSIGLLIGAFVHVKGNNGFDIPDSVVGSRIRLSYMLAPYYRLPLRNFKETRLSTALRIALAGQRSMLFK